MTRRYQSHAGLPPGNSDSAAKLAQLRLPENLAGATVLDLGCNEGYFSAAAAERGAVVTGIDLAAESLQFARERYGHLGIDFRQASWHELPDGPFDIVLWTSAMHYEPNPGLVLRRVRDILAPSGLLILECGVAPGLQRQMSFVQRHVTSHWYPTESYLRDVLLADFVIRPVSRDQLQPGDPIPRSVFHCTPLRPTVLLVHGASGSGKTHVARLLERSATTTVALDGIVHYIARGQFHLSDLEILIRDQYKPAERRRLYEAIDNSGLSEDLADVIAGSVTSSDRLVVIEGAFTPRQLIALRRALEHRAIVWEVAREGGDRAVIQTDSPALEAASPTAAVTAEESTDQLLVATLAQPGAASTRHVENGDDGSQTDGGAAIPSVRRFARRAKRRFARTLATVLPARLLFVFWRNPLFDRAWYLMRNTDVEQQGVDPERHYRLHGVREGRDPSPFFSTTWYRDRYAEATVGRMNPLDHYYFIGGFSGLAPSSLFDSAEYIRNNPDVQASEINPLLHYVRYGTAERRPRPVPRGDDPNALDP